MSDSVVASLVNAGMGEMEALNKARLFDDAERQLSAVSGAKILRWFVPGRIEVLGKHTDYGGGRSLLCTAERGFCIAAAPRSDSLVRINDVIRRQNFEFTISPDLEIPRRSWPVYSAVVARRLARNFPGSSARRGHRFGQRSSLRRRHEQFQRPGGRHIRRAQRD